MDLNTKIKLSSVAILGSIFILFVLANTNINYNATNNLEQKYESILYIEDLKISKISEKIFINGTSDWVDLKNEGNCTGQGTYSDPYVIKDLVINGFYIGTCIWIENSDVYFKIENCTGYNAGNYGIYLNNVSNGHLVNNTFSSNIAEGINLYRSHNNTILETNINNNYEGIRLYDSNNNNISGNQLTNNYAVGIGNSNSNNTIVIGNTIDYNSIGIDLWKSNNTLVSGNIMNECGLRIFGNIELLSSNNIDTTNIVNGKQLYYYTNEIGLKSNNFTNAGQVILINCNDSSISDLDVSHSSRGILLYNCNKNNISGNIANNNLYGISLDNCNNNTISGNEANDNFWNGIDLWGSNNNIITGNTANRNSAGIGLWKSNYSIITGNILSSNIYYGIWLEMSNNNTISGNTATSNAIGLFLDNSNYNRVTGNNLIENDECISEVDCEGNLLENNDCNETPAIIGYDLLYLLGSICLVSMILLRKTKLSKK
ncbi:MAG: right-handed parallel beta-helix repeat-containing protein [Candidatus Lokiarchaeota archaeon]|nr:right-handed parallel beta-helix repeat-containing protein [Candidatus Lokiarchaeota archaeon]